MEKRLGTPDLKHEDALLIADSYINSPQPYTDTMASLTERYGQPHQLALRKIADLMESPTVGRGDTSGFKRFALRVRALVGLLEQLGESGQTELSCGSHEKAAWWSVEAMLAPSPGRFWVRLKFTGGGAPPTGDFVGETLLLQTCWINASDIYSFIALPNKRDFELCFYHEAPLRRFLEVHSSKSADPKWINWTVESSIQIDTANLKFWTVSKPVNKFGIWYGIRKFKVKLKKDSNGHLVRIPNSISLGPYNGRIIYPGQNTTCFICQSPEHQVRQCPLVKCWRCGHFGHKAKDCQSEALCSLCDERGHTYFTCPSSYSNKFQLRTQAERGNISPIDRQRERTGLWKC
uniref:CCHC-type domain-containing protein n=1 Tax=Neogobius melanostomus TaxID=47308 RepID=A0A8C6TVN5_9GOBI